MYILEGPTSITDPHLSSTQQQHHYLDVLPETDATHPNHCDHSVLTSCHVVNIFKADQRTCNGVIPHPYAPVLVSYGIDSDVKVFGTQRLYQSSEQENKEDENVPNKTTNTATATTAATTDINPPRSLKILRKGTHIYILPNTTNNTNTNNAAAVVLPCYNPDNSELMDLPALLEDNIVSKSVYDAYVIVIYKTVCSYVILQFIYVILL